MRTQGGGAEWAFLPLGRERAEPEGYSGGEENFAFLPWHIQEKNLRPLIVKENTELLRGVQLACSEILSLVGEADGGCPFCVLDPRPSWTLRGKGSRKKSSPTSGPTTERGEGGGLKF